MAKHFLYLTNERLNCFRWQRGRVISSESFVAQDTAPREFERYIFKYRHESVYLVLDLTEEDFRQETIPHLSGSDQQAVLNRKLSQVYRNSTLRHAIVQGRESEGRRDDRVLYHGITNPDLLKPWLTVLERLGIPIQGIYSSPILSGELLRKLDVFFPHTLLVTMVSGDGLRQTYFQNKQIKFSRLTLLDHSEEKGRGRQIAEETSRTWQYLDSLRFFSGSETLEVCVLVHPDTQSEVAEAIRDYPLLQHRLLNITEVARALGMKEPPASAYADELLVHLFAGSRLENHFALPAQTRVARLSKVGGLIHIGSAAIATGCAIVAGTMLVDTQRVGVENDRRSDQTLRLARQHKAIIDQMQIAQVTSETSKDTAAFNAAYLQPVPAPADLLVAVSSVLDRFPNVKLGQLAWQVSAEEKTQVVLPPAGAAARLDIISEPGTTAALAPQVAVAPSTAAPANAVSLPGSIYQILILDASVFQFKGEYRKLLEDLNELVTALGQLPGCSASLIKSPLDTSTNANIRGVLGATPQAPSEAQFSVRVVRVLTPKSRT